MKIAFYHYVWPHYFKNQNKEFKQKISEYLVINNLIKALEKNGQKVIKYSKTPPLSYKNADDIKIFRHGIYQLVDLLKFLLNPPDFLCLVSKSIYNSYTLVPILRFLCQIRKVKLIVFMGHDESPTSLNILENVKPYKYQEDNFWQDKKELLARLERNRLYRPRHKNEYICVPSSIIKRNCINEGWKSKQIMVLPHGVDTNFFHPAQNNDLKGSGKIKFLFAGNGATRKGLPYLLQAFEKLSKKHNISLTIVSHGVQNIKIPHVNIQKDITDEKLLKLYQTHNIFILPSLLDGWGLTATEAMACGLPVVISEITGVSDIIKNGVNGIIIKPKNPEEIYRALNKLINDKYFTQRLGEEARKITLKYNWSYIGKLFTQKLAALK